ncbi:FtsQ-type POTRA domain-containing protein [bacterium]|nr:FtsQ-type POTRA domain-containing protein [bacterium]
MANSRRKSATKGRQTSRRTPRKSTRNRTARSKPRKKIGRWILLAMVLSGAGYYTYPKVQQKLNSVSATDEISVVGVEERESQPERSTVEVETEETSSETAYNLVPDWWYSFVDSTWTPFLREKFPVKEVQIRGLYGVDESIITDALGDLAGLSIFEVPIDEIEDKLEKHTRISRALLNREYPTTLVVEIKENREIATVILEGKPFGVDKTGLILSDGRSGYRLDAPMISGITLKTKPGKTIENEAVLMALDWISNSNHLPRISQWISGIKVNKDGIIRIEGMNNCNVLPGDQSVNAQLAALDKFLATDNYTQRIGCELDLRFPGFLIVRKS